MQPNAAGLHADPISPSPAPDKSLLDVFADVAFANSIGASSADAE